MDWSQRFEKLAQIYSVQTKAKEKNEDQSLSIPNKPSRSPAFLPHEATSDMNKNGTLHSPPSPAPSSPISSVAVDIRFSYVNKYNPELPSVPTFATNSIADESKTNVPLSMSNDCVQAYPFPETTYASSHSLKSNSQMVVPRSASICQTQIASSFSLMYKQQPDAQTAIASKHKPDTTVTTINNLYTNPAQRSTAAVKALEASHFSPGEPSKEPIENGHLINNSNSHQCSSKITPQISSSSFISYGNQKVTTSANSVKGVETWC